MAPYLVDERKRYRGAAQAVVRPSTTDEVSRVVAHVRGTGKIPDRAAGRQYRALRRGDAGFERPRAGSQPGAAQPGARGRSAQLHHHRRGRRDPGRRTEGGGGGRPAVPALARRRGDGADRRQSVDQCGRHRRAALRQCARPRARARGGAARRAGVGRAVGTPQGQYRLRPETPVHRRGGDARHHHRGGAKAVSPPAGGGDRAGGDRRPGGRGGPARPGAGGDGGQGERRSSSSCDSPSR